MLRWKKKQYLMAEKKHYLMATNSLPQPLHPQTSHLSKNHKLAFTYEEMKFNETINFLTLRKENIYIHTLLFKTKQD